MRGGFTSTLRFLGTANGRSRLTTVGNFFDASATGSRTVGRHSKESKGEKQ